MPSEQIRNKIRQAKQEGRKELDLSFSLSTGWELLTEIPPEVFDLERLEVLNLQGNGINTLPDELLKLTHLRELNISDNLLESLPERLGELEGLTSLNVRSNNLGSLPEWMGELKGLTSLDISNNSLGSLPEWLGELKSLTSLNVSDNLLERLSEWLGELNGLTFLNIRNNRLRSLPEWMGEIKGLTSLDISNNSLGSLPEWLGELKSLTSLNVSYNGLRSLPERLGELKGLTSLGISNNRLRSLPERLGELKGLTSLDISNNSLGSLPEWMGELKSLTSLRIRNNHLEHLPEWLGELKSLTSLDIDFNGLERLPEWLREIKGLTSLGVSNNRLRSLPEWMGELKDLTSLRIRNNHLEHLPERLGELKGLTSLDISYNSLGSLPEWMGELKGLTFLNVSDNRLRSLPEWMGELKGLTSLDVSYNGLESLPERLGELKGLTFLNIRNNRLRSLPEWMGELKSLTALDVSRNGLGSLPERLGELKGLTSLDVSYNGLESLPEWMGEIKSLASLDISDNKIKSLSNVQRIIKLRHLRISENPLQIPPFEIAQRGIEAVKEYFRQLEGDGIDHIYEAKLLIIGEGGAGKTTLAKKIVNPDYELRPDEESTEGIEVCSYLFTMNNGQTFQINIWDFGGQEIYHATHQFFLSKRSLYVLVADTRKEDTDFYYWLNVVELLSDNSPLLIVKNEKQDRHREINDRQLRGQFSNLKEILSTNLGTNRGLDKVISELQHHICGLPHIGSPLPRKWVKVRKTLERDLRNHISLNDYLKICQQNGFTDLKDKLQLSDYLHDLGVCLHFQDDPLLKKTVILKPKWGTDAVYRVLDNKKVIENLGKFSRTDLADVWHEAEYADMQDELLQLMINFKLCYPIQGTPYYIAPQLLSENQPDYDWDGDNNLLLRYEYEFMPKGILTQFIVAMHPWILDQRYVWKSGLLIEKNQARAEVIEYYGKKEVHVRVSGKHKRELMTIVMHELGKIHDSYKRLQYKTLIPCNCPTCAHRPEPTFYPRDLLMKFVADHKKIQCTSSYEMVDPLGLIDDVMDKNLMEIQERDSRNPLHIGRVDRLIYQQGEKGTYMEKEVKNEKVITIGDGATISAPVVVADTIENSFNKLAEANVEDKTKALLDELLKAINEAVKQAPEEEMENAEAMARDAEALVKEAASTKPRPRWYEMSVDGIKDAAAALGGIAKPVLDIVNQLRPLLLPDN